MELMTERLESLKAGIIGGASLYLAFCITSLINTLVLTKFVFAPSSLLQPHWHWWLTAIIAGFSGFLFGVTYRYIIRTDNNSHLKSGGVLAFGLVRGLTQLDFSFMHTIIPSLLQAGESILYFAIGAIALNAAMQKGWLKPFSSQN